MRLVASSRAGMELLRLATARLAIIDFKNGYLFYEFEILNPGGKPTGHVKPLRGFETGCIPNSPG